MMNRTKHFGAMHCIACIALVAIIGFGLTACGGSSPASTNAKTVSVGEQDGTLTVGTAGTVSFIVTTRNIEDGSSIGLISPRADISLGKATIRDNSAIISISTTAATPVGQHSLTVTVTDKTTNDEISSKPFTLFVSPSGEKSVSVGVQDGTLVTRTPGSAAFPVTTANIADGETGDVLWFTSTSSKLPAPSLPTGITVSTVSDVSGNTATVTITIDNLAMAGEYLFRVVIDETRSAITALTIDPLHP